MDLSSQASIITGAVGAGAERVVRDMLEQAGIRVNGDAPHDIIVHDSALYARILRDGGLGLGEAYMDGWWDSPALDKFIEKVTAARLGEKVRGWRSYAYAAAARALNFQSKARAFQVGEQHYDIGNDLYERMLDKRLAYTCAYWRAGAKDLDEAQDHKLDLVCRKVGLKPGMKVLELGCGWGPFAKYAAEKYGVQVTGYTVSREQVALGRKLCAGLPVDLILDDYRNARGTYDAVVSIGLMEHVGYKNHRTYMKLVDRTLAPGGTAFIHTIGGNYKTKLISAWYHKYIFPNAVLPTLGQLASAMEGIFVPEDVHNIGPDYDPTLMAWNDRFEAAWPELAPKYGERFRRMWRYYLLSCAGSFRSRYLQLFQIVMTRPPTPQPACRLS